MPPTIRITIEVEDLQRAQKIAVAISLLRYLGMTRGIEGAVEAADEATEALQELATEVERDGSDKA